MHPSLWIFPLLIRKRILPRVLQEQLSRNAIRHGLALIASMPQRRQLPPPMHRLAHHLLVMRAVAVRVDASAAPATRGRGGSARGRTPDVTEGGGSARGRRSGTSGGGVVPQSRRIAPRLSQVPLLVCVLVARNNK